VQTNRARSGNGKNKRAAREDQEKDEKGNEARAAKGKEGDSSWRAFGKVEEKKKDQDLRPLRRNARQLCARDQATESPDLLSCHGTWGRKEPPFPPQVRASWRH